MANTTIHAFISGRVQGVRFRAATQKKARQLNLTGYTKNLSDGRVEVIACGEQEAIKLFITWLGKGPILSKVSDVNWKYCTQAELSGYADFSIK